MAPFVARTFLTGLHRHDKAVSRHKDTRIIPDLYLIGTKQSDRIPSYLSENYNLPGRNAEHPGNIILCGG